MRVQTLILDMYHRHLHEFHSHAVIHMLSSWWILDCVGSRGCCTWLLRQVRVPKEAVDILANYRCALAKTLAQSCLQLLW